MVKKLPGKSPSVTPTSANLNPRALKKLREKDSQGQLLLKANQGGSRPLTISVRQSNGSQWQQCFIEGVNSNSSSYDSEQYKQFR